MPDSRDPFLPAWASALLRAPVHSAAESRAAIMDAVRREPVPRRASHARRSAFLRAPMRPSRWPRRGLLTPFGAAAIAATFAAIVSVQSVRSVRSLSAGADGGALQTAAFILGDTVVPSMRHGLVGATIHDTLRIVEFVLRGRDVRSAAVVGDFNAWRRGATVLRQDSDGAWRARVVVPRDVVRFAYVVNGAPGDARAAASPHEPAAAPHAARVRLDSI